MPLESGDAAGLPPTYEKPSVYDAREGRTHGFATLPPWLQAIAMGSDDWNMGTAQREDKTSGSEGVGMGGKTPAQALRGAKVPMDNPAQVSRPAATGELDAMSDDVPF
jgi:hypothetical protein